MMRPYIWKFLSGPTTEGWSDLALFISYNSAGLNNDAETTIHMEISLWT